jgi:renalase
VATVAIIGAGSAGMAAAHVLQDAGHTATLFEKSSAPGGRATTRRRSGYIYDPGAQYIKGGSPLSTELVSRRFYVNDLINISKPVWIFDAQGQVAQGDPVQNAEPRWSYRGGLSSLARRMAEGLDVRLDMSVQRCEQTPRGWQLFNEQDTALGSYERLLITIPASQAAELVTASRLPEAVHALLSQAHYHPLISLILAYTPGPRLRPYYALVNTDKAHPISWLAWEHEKAPERVPPNHGLLIAQMAPGYSREHWQTPAQELLRDVAERVRLLLNEPLDRPIFTDIQYWLYALPSTLADARALNNLTMPMGLAFCGDAFVGGRVHLALEHGCEVARQLAGISPR